MIDHNSNTTYLTEYNNVAPGQNSHVAGTFDQQFGSFPRWRALGNLSWQLGDFSASWPEISGRPLVIVGTPNHRNTTSSQPPTINRRARGSARHSQIV